MIKKRIIQLLEFKGIAKENFYKEIGMTSANFRGKASETPINSNAIVNILSIIPDLNIYWLLTGDGDMLLKKESNLILDNIYKELAESRLQTICSKEETIDGLKREMDLLKNKLEEKSNFQSSLGGSISRVSIELDPKEEEEYNKVLKNK